MKLFNINLSYTNITDNDLLHLKEPGNPIRFLKGVYNIDLRYTNITKKCIKFLKNNGTITIY